MCFSERPRADNISSEFYINNFTALFYIFKNYVGEFSTCDTLMALGLNSIQGSIVAQPAHAVEDEYRSCDSICSEGVAYLKPECKNCVSCEHRDIPGTVPHGAAKLFQLLLPMGNDACSCPLRSNSEKQLSGNMVPE